MIRYALRCENAHEFDGWFRSSEGYDALRKAGQVACTICGSARVEKALMAPNVGTVPGKGALDRPGSDAEAALQALRRHIEQNTEHVGMSFAAEARAIHDGDAPNRAIHGEARLEDARKLLEDGIAVAPLPFRPRQGLN